jgi:mono/diheme cytochrome c family protein
MSDKPDKPDKPSPQEREARESLEKGVMQDKQMQQVHAQLMREKEEPSEGFSPVPIFLLFIFGALVFWAGVYFVHNSGDFRWDAYSPDFRADAADAATAVVWDPIARGGKIFRNQCAQCHQPTGNGVPGVYPPLAGAEWVTGSERRLARILINGLNGPIEVKGNTYNGNMPAFGPNGLGLRSREIAAVLTYIRQEWGNTAPEITEEAMDGYLADYGSRSAPWTAGELLADDPMEP